MIDLFKSLTTSQLRAALKTLGQSIDLFDDEAWEADHMDGAVNNVVFHTLFYADLYLNRGEEGFEDQPFHKKNPDFFRDYEEKENRPPTNFYERDKCREYLEFCMEKARSMIRVPLAKINTRRIAHLQRQAHPASRRTTRIAQPDSGRPASQVGG